MKNETDIAVIDAGAITHKETLGPVQVPSIEVILQTAIERGTDPATLERLMALYERVQANGAKQAFDAAMGAFKAECPPIPRNHVNPFFKKVTRDGRSVPSTYAALDDIEKTIAPLVAKHGLSYRWGDAVVNGDLLTVPCIVSHGGHSESASASVGIDSKAGNQSQQKYGVAMKYARRMSIESVFGLVTADCEDGNPPKGGADAGEKITEGQAADLDSLLTEVGANRAVFLKMFEVHRVEDLPRANFKAACNLLEEKRKANRTAKPEAKQ